MAMHRLTRLLSQVTDPMRVLNYTLGHGVGCPSSLILAKSARTLTHSAHGGVGQPRGCSVPQHSALASLTHCGFHCTAQQRILEDHNTKSLAVWTNLKELKASPVPALTLGLSGLIPFMVAPMYMVSASLYMPDIAFAQLAYGATVLSFVGGVRWGFVIPKENPVQADWVNLGYSIVPALIAWSGLLMPPSIGLLTVMAGLSFSAYADMAMYGYPPWFKGMRFVLSFIAILSLWSTFMCSFVMNTNAVESKHEHDNA